MNNARILLSVMLACLIVLPFAGCMDNRDEAMTTYDTGTTSDVLSQVTTTSESVSTVVDTEAETTTAQQTSSGGYEVLNYSDFKAMWLSQYDLNKVYCSGSKQRSEESFTKYMVQILENVKSVGINTIIVQVRPNADSMYPSEYYPMSIYVVGSYGNEADYDPFEIIVEKAHELGLSVQAWINPLRGMSDANITKIPEKYQIRRWYNDKVTKGKQLVLKSGTWYLNPAYEDVRQLIIDGAREILEKYDVDGLHMDDYFYPTTDTSFDSAAYNQYLSGGGKQSLANWRRANLNALVSGLWNMVKQHNPELLFGISPAGNFNTVYDSHYADIYEWCSKQGYIDYICPQAYFGLEHGSYDFVKVVSKYHSMIKTDSVKLIVGMTLGKAFSASKGETDKYAGSGAREWIENKDVLKRELERTKDFEKCTGVAYFCYQYFFDPISGVQVSGTLKERQNFLPVLQSITWQ